MIIAAKELAATLAVYLAPSYCHLFGDHIVQLYPAFPSILRDKETVHCAYIQLLRIQRIHRRIYNLYGI